MALELPNERSLFVEGNGFELSNSEVVHFMREGFNGPDVNLMTLIHKFVLVLPKIRHWYTLEVGGGVVCDSVNKSRMQTVVQINIYH